MGRTSESGGVCAKGRNRIQFTFVYEGRRHRPTLKRKPTEANLRRARLQLEDIEARIDAGTFKFAEEFPGYRFQKKLPANQRPADLIEAKQENAVVSPAKPDRTCNDVFNAFLRQCEVRVASHDLAYSTLNSYWKILDRSWRPRLGTRVFKSVTYSQLVEIAGAQGWKTKLE